MSRVNVDVKAFSDVRFKLLGKKLGRTDKEARGLMLEVWSYCTNNQTYFVTEEILDVLIGKKNFGKFAVESDLMREDCGKLYVCGTRGRIEWLDRLRENSKKGGAANARKALSKSEDAENSTPTLPSDDESQTKARRLARSKPDESPLSLAPSPALTLTNKSIANTLESGSPSLSSGKEKLKTETTEIWEYYSEELKSKNSITAIRGAKEFSLIKKLVSEFGIDSTKKMINRFLDDTDRFVVDQAYQVGLLYSQRQKYFARSKEFNLKEFSFEGRMTMGELRAIQAAKEAEQSVMSGNPLVSG